MSDILYRRVYADVIRGYSETRWADKTVYVKHLGTFDYTEIDALKELALDDAVGRGVKTEDEKVEWLADRQLWGRKDETDLAMQRSFVDNLEKTRSKLALRAQIDQVDSQLREARDKLATTSNHRRKLIGLTAEEVADQRVQHEYIRLSFYQDAALTVPVFTTDDIAALTDQEADYLLMTYITIVGQFSPDNLRQIAISPFFGNQFYLCGDRLEVFFGKPIVQLTIYQANLLTYGNYFRHILTQNDLPADVLKNPDKIEEYMNRSRNLKSLVNKAGPGDRVALIGATADDFKAMGVEDGSAKVHADIKRGVKSGVEAAKTREVTANTR